MTTTSGESFGGRPTLAAGVGVTQAASAKLQDVLDAPPHEVAEISEPSGSQSRGIH